MPRGYELTDFYDVQRAVQRKIYSREIKKLSGIIKDFGYLNNNLYGLIISSVNNGLEDNMGRFAQDMHHMSKQDIGVNLSSRLQDFMSPLELRANSMAVRKARINISKLGRNVSVSQIQQVAYDAGQSVGLEVQTLKKCKDKSFSMQINSPVLSTTPIIKKYDKALIKGEYPKGYPVVYTDIRESEREGLILANKIMFTKVKEQLVRLGLVDKSNKKTAFKMLNLGYYYIEDPMGASLEPAVFCFSDNYDKKLYHHTELSMNLEKLTMAYEKLITITNASVDTIYKSMFAIGIKARNVVVSEYRMFPEMFSGFYNIYSIAEQQNAINKQRLEDARKAKNQIK